MAKRTHGNNFMTLAQTGTTIGEVVQIAQTAGVCIFLIVWYIFKEKPRSEAERQQANDTMLQLVREERQHADESTERRNMESAKRREKDDAMHKTVLDEVRTTHQTVLQVVTTHQQETTRLILVHCEEESQKRNELVVNALGTFGKTLQDLTVSIDEWKFSRPNGPKKGMQ